MLRKYLEYWINFIIGSFLIALFFYLIHQGWKSPKFSIMLGVIFFLLVLTILVVILCKEKTDFFDKPDYWIAAINIGGENIWARVKNDLALLRGIPKPSSGFHYNDIIRVNGPIGKTYYRDDEVPLFKPLELVKQSNLITFEFYAIVPSYKDWFDLRDIFHNEKLYVKFPYLSNNFDLKWHKGWCIVENLDQANSLLEKYKTKGLNRDFRDITLA
jgi:hypothetical protein